MKAMILAAGRGERMRPLTDHTPKPLLPVGGKPLIAWHIERLRDAGFTDIVINHAHLGEQIEAAFGNGSALGVRIAWSPESAGALETAGGIRHALPLLGNAPFLVVNGDIWCDWPFERARQIEIDGRRQVHLVMVRNPPHNTKGDFTLDHGRILSAETAAPRLTFSGIGIYTPSLFAGLADPAPAKLAPIIRAAADAGHVSGELHTGEWIDVGTPERLHEIDKRLHQHGVSAKSCST